MAFIPFYSTEALSFPDRDPVFLAISPDGLRLVATINEAFLVRDGKQLDSVPITGWGMCAAFNPTRPEVAVGAKVSLIIYVTKTHIHLHVVDVVYMYTYIKHQFTTQLILKLYTVERLEPPYKGHLGGPGTFI